jgi:hypothetical protein
MRKSWGRVYVRGLSRGSLHSASLPAGRLCVDELQPDVTGLSNRCFSEWFQPLT